MSNSEIPKPSVNIAVVILAAGSSSRLGKPKQLLYYQNETLIKHAVKTACLISPKLVIVVSGFLHDELVSELENERVLIVHNPDWQEGMGSSIRVATASLPAAGFPEIDAALILLCDQPLISVNHLEKLVAQFYADKRSKIVATAYAGTQGVPTIFDRSLFPVLETLAGNRGAQWLLKQHQEMIAAVPFEGAAIDVDTKEDYLRLLKLSENKKEYFNGWHPATPLYYR